MNTYTIYIGAHPIACVCGHDAAYACYEAARTIAEYTNRPAYLIWDETGEQVAGYGSADEDYYEDDDDLECGFDPYCGCYTDDC